MLKCGSGIKKFTPADKQRRPAAIHENKTGRRLNKSFLSAFRGDKRHDRDGAGALNGHRQFSLVTGAVTGDSSGHDFAALCDKITENDRVFIVNFNIGVRAETAEFLSVEKFLISRT